MSEKKIKSSIISDLIKIDGYRSKKTEPGNTYLQEVYTDQSIDDLKRIHDIYIRYLLDYRQLGEPYPSVIENLEFTDKKIESCISDHKHQAN